MQRSSAFIVAAAAIVAGSLAASATSSNPLKDFSSAGTGPWSALGADHGAAPSPLAVMATACGLAPCVNNGLSMPDSISVIDTASNGILAAGTAGIKPDNLSPASDMVLSRWTAPVATPYTATDSQSTTPLLPATLLAAYGSGTNSTPATIRFAVSDFVNVNAQTAYGYTSPTTSFDPAILKANGSKLNGADPNITNAAINGADTLPTDVPEPGSLLLLGIGVLALGVTRTRLKSSPAPA